MTYGRFWFNACHIVGYFEDFLATIPWNVLRQTGKMAISTALSLEATVPPVMLSFNHKAHNAPTYQISAQSISAQLSYHCSSIWLGT